ncbi:MAG: T9SS type A sorting domain-containing protein, partial [Bacteroidetes bacterium]|nr:T9SS type A sorting domain-containing protein [Bacteroidota bacterium]
WTYVSALPSPNPPVNSMYVVNANIMWLACDAAGGVARVYKTTNGGTTWLLRNTGIPTTENGYGMFAFDTTTAFVGTTSGTLYRTTNGGMSWTSVLAVSGSFTNGVHMFTQNYGIYFGDPTGSGQPFQMRMTNNGGVNWYLPAGAPTASVANEWGVINAWDWMDSSHVWTGSAIATSGASACKIFRTSTGYYGTWSNTSVTGTGSTSGIYWQAVAFVTNTNGLIGSSAGDIKKTTDGGATFTSVTPPSGLSTFSVMNMNSSKSDGTIRMSIQGDTTRIFKTTDLGTTWIREAIPLQATLGQVSHIQFLNANLGYAALGGTGLTGGLIKYTGPSSVGNETGVAESFKLSQNYPNPFNPSTAINFSLAKSGFVTLKVYNSLGKEVATLINENMTAGSHEVTYNASELNSGIYFYRLTANGMTDTKKMMLVK